MKGIARALLDHRGGIGRAQFLLVEMVRAVGLLLCYALYRADYIVVAAVLVPAAVWPGIVGTIKRFRDLGHDPLLILPVLMFLAGGFTGGHVLGQQGIGLITLSIYLTYVLGFPGRRNETPKEVSHADDPK